MELKSFYFWLLVELSSYLLLLSGLSSWQRIASFFVLHGICVALALIFFFAGATADRNCRKYIGMGFYLPALTLCLLPLAGPAGIIMLTFIFLFFPVSSPAEEEFEPIGDYWLENYSESIEEYSFYHMNAVNVIYQRLSFEQSMWILGNLERLNWFSNKAKLLKFFLAYSQYPSIVLEASRMLINKQDNLLKNIELLMNNPEENSLKIAKLYYEIYFIEILNPPLDRLYLISACEYILKALQVSGGDPDTRILAVKYLLNCGRAEEAEKILLEGKSKFSDDRKFLMEVMRYEEELQYKKGRFLSNLRERLENG